MFRLLSPCRWPWVAVFGALMALNAGAQQQWDFDRYHKEHPEQVSALKTSQSGKTNLEPALRFKLPGRNEGEGWLEAWRDLLGPSARNQGPLDARVLEEKQFESYVRRKVEYTADPGERVRAWLFIPKKREGKAPAMLCLHQTVRSGKDQAAGVAEIQPELAYGPLLAERGFVTLCPDAICFGERYQVGGNFYCHYGDAVRIYQGNAGRSILSKMVDDGMRAVDYLESLPEVDAKRIGSIGHSHGGYGTLFLMAYDPRIKAGVASCGFTCFRTDPTPDRWYRKTALIPRLGTFENHLADTPVDFHHLFAAVAPRPLFVSAALQDAIFPNLGPTAWIERDVKTVYAREQKPENFELLAFEGAHAFTPQARDRAWAFLAKHLQSAPAGPPGKQHSAFFGPAELEVWRRNAQASSCEAKGAGAPKGLLSPALSSRGGEGEASHRLRGVDAQTTPLLSNAVAQAEFWQSLSDEQLWGLVFGPSIPRSWMVWSDGDCPACHKPVKMYDWVVEAQKQPWKLRCPHCRELFPKNDFAAFYRSGLDSRGLFDPSRADRSLLFNTEHPQADDPLRGFGVDDGQGFASGGKRWRFIGAYLVYGQFKQLILGGIRSLSTAYVLTGEAVYAHKAAVLLDRLADVYPSFDYAQQGLVYEKGGISGYVSVWHDACEETRELALGYDRIFTGMEGDDALVRFLSGKAKAAGLSNPKESVAQIRRNIEQGLLRDPLAHPEKIHSNYPRSEMARSVLMTVLGWPENRKEVEVFIDSFLKQATAVDGVTGEKGLSNYSGFTIQSLAEFLELFSRSNPDFLPALLKRNPRLLETWRFHADTYCIGRYYPRSGDCGLFAVPEDKYVGAIFQPKPADPLTPSVYSFFWRLYQASGESLYAKILYRENGSSTDGLPHDLFCGDATAMRKGVEQLIRKEGASWNLASINKQQWHLAILRSGQGASERAVWLDYDSGGGHSHHDGMTLGLFARGLDLLPDFGYVPVQFGGWETPQVEWYRASAAHNTVVVDGRNQADGAGATTLWGDGQNAHVVRASAPGLVGGGQFERTVALVDAGPDDFYVASIFRVSGGSSHVQTIYPPYNLAGKNMPRGETAPNPLGPGAMLRDVKAAAVREPGWAFECEIEDHHKLLPPRTAVTLRYLDGTIGGQGLTAEAWVAPYKSLPESAGVWIPCGMVRRQGQAPLTSTFAGVFEAALNGKPCVKALRRLELSAKGGTRLGEDAVALEVQLASGARDLLLVANPSNPATLAGMEQAEWGVKLEGEFCWLRRAANGRLKNVFLAKATRLQCGGREVVVEGGAPAEIEFGTFSARVVKGDAGKVRIARH